MQHPNEAFSAALIIAAMIDAHAERITKLATGGTRRGIAAENRFAIECLKQDNAALEFALASL